MGVTPTYITQHHESFTAMLCHDLPPIKHCTNKKMLFFKSYYESIDIGIHTVYGVAAQIDGQSISFTRNHTKLEIQSLLTIFVLIVECWYHFVAMQAVIHWLIPSHSTHDAMTGAVHRHTNQWSDASENISLTGNLAFFDLSVFEHSIHIDTPLQLLGIDSERHRHCHQYCQES